MVFDAEPLLERWPFSVAYHHAAGKLQLMISSEACLNLVATASAFRSLGDARRFMQDLAAPVAAVLVPPARSAPGKAPLTSSKPTSLCSNYRSVSQPAYQAVSWAAHKRVTVTILWQGCIIAWSMYCIMTHSGRLGPWCMHT